MMLEAKELAMIPLAIMREPKTIINPHGNRLMRRPVRIPIPDTRNGNNVQRKQKKKKGRTVKNYEKEEFY